MSQFWEIWYLKIRLQNLPDTIFSLAFSQYVFYPHTTSLFFGMLASSKEHKIIATKLLSKQLSLKTCQYDFFCLIH